MFKSWMKRQHSDFYQIFEAFVHPAWQKVNRHLLLELETLFQQWPGFPKTDHRSLYEFMIHHINARVQDIEQLHQTHVQFTYRFKHAVVPEEEQEYILEYAQILGANTRQLIGDRRAFNRWFGYDAIVDRYNRRFAALEQKLAFYLDLLQPLIQHLLHEESSIDGHQKAWKRLALEEVITPILTYEGDDRVRIAAFMTLAAGVGALPVSMQEHSVNEQSLHFIYRAVMEHKQNVWIQCAAFELLQSLSSHSFERALKQRLSQPQKGDDLFVRRKAVQLLGKHLNQVPNMVSIFSILRQDPSPFVRQAVADSLHFVNDATLLETLRFLVRHDPAPQVRAAAMISIPTYLKKVTLTAALQTILFDALLQEDDVFVLKTALKVALDGFLTLTEDHPNKANWLESSYTAFDYLHQQSPHLQVRHYAAQIHEQLWSHADIDALSLKDYFQHLTATMYAGQSKKIHANILAQYDTQSIGRTLALLAQNDFPYEVISMPLRGVHLYKGHRFKFRLWRCLYEFFRPSPDKRQAFSHTTGRSFRGLMHIPSGVLAEVAETKVPGEPLLIAEENDWRSFLPLVDELLCCLDYAGNSKPLTIYSLQGITTLHPPVSLIQRAYAKTRLTLNFAHYAAMRNWHKDQMMPTTRYVDALKKLGFRATFQPHAHGGLSTDPKVQRFFSFIPFTGIEFWQRLRDYFLSMYQNSLYDLIFCITAVIGTFVGRHLYLSQQLKTLRKQLPLSIGGWGTRGKSGTERLKAGMINALGHHLISKTTGCEALFLHAYPFGKLREMFLFRPYDKATIWEQYNLLHISKGLGADVFLWECMALTPEYVKIMQRQWMHDDIATITNTHPDHEDLQGPAGINIPQVMTNFIPEKSVLLTTEEQMMPILREEANKVGTRIEVMGWQEAGLLTDDILARFPYDEHPYNIALVIALGKELGVSKAFALKEMADRVVLDIGVLKVFPKARRASRTLEFTNGMSANERFGCLGNWKRVGFDCQNIYDEPGTWISTVVNNRADRVARSRVFAAVLAQDLQAEKHFLIGSNLGGLMHDVRAAWQNHIAPIALFAKGSEDKHKAIEVLEKIAQKLRIPYTEAHIQHRVQVMLQGIGITDHARLKSILHVDDLSKLQGTQAEQYCAEIRLIWLNYSKTLQDYEAIAAEITQQNTNKDALNQHFRDQITVWFEQKFVIIENYHASGEQIIDCIYQHTPPGITNRIMGIQNIKGTGMDFIYRWIAWEDCHNACQKMTLKSKRKAQQGLRELFAFQQFGLLSEEMVRARLHTFQHYQWAQVEIFQAELQVIGSRLDEAMQKIQHNLSATQVSLGLRSWLLSKIETWLDAGDAVKRRKKADAIYRDLIKERISHDCASSELKALNSRQKGGWLIQQLQHLLSKK